MRFTPAAGYSVGSQGGTRSRAEAPDVQRPQGGRLSHQARRSPHRSISIPAASTILGNFIASTTRPSMPLLFLAGLCSSTVARLRPPTTKRNSPPSWPTNFPTWHLRHGTNQLTKAQYAQLGAGIMGAAGGIFGGTAGAAAAGAGQFTFGSVLLHNSRGAETQADVMGTQVLYDSGYDPRAMAAFFENLNAIQLKAKHHPSFSLITPTRIIALIAWMRRSASWAEPPKERKKTLLNSKPSKGKLWLFRRRSKENLLPHLLNQTHLPPAAWMLLRVSQSRMSLPPMLPKCATPKLRSPTQTTGKTTPGKIVSYSFRREASWMQAMAREHWPGG